MASSSGAEEEWGPKHRAWLERLLHEERLAPQDRAVYSEYLALIDYKLGRRDELDRQIEEVVFRWKLSGVEGR